MYKWTPINCVINNDSLCPAKDLLSFSQRWHKALVLIGYWSVHQYCEILHSLLIQPIFTHFIGQDKSGEISCYGYAYGWSGKLERSRHSYTCHTQRCTVSIHWLSLSCCSVCLCITASAYFKELCSLVNIFPPFYQSVASFF